MEQILLRGRLIDPLSDHPVEDGALLIEGNRIVYAGEAAGCPQTDAAVYECKGGSILPGFIDVHAHLSGEEDAGSFADGRMFGDQLVGSVYQIGLLLDAGFTSLRDMSEAGLYLSRGVERGVIRGPRIMPGGKVLSITSGHVDDNPEMTPEYFNSYSHTCQLCDGVDGCVRAVREQFRMGAKFIKICATGGVSSPTDRVDDVQFSPEELRAIVGEAKRHHTYVCAHCTGYEGAYQALLAGVSCIEHGVMLTQREIDLMAEKGAFLVSTLWISLNVATLPGLPDWMREKASLCAEANKKTIAMARKAGIRIALGTDFSNSRNTPYLENGREFEAMVRAGMTPMESIRAGTINAAAVMGMEDTLGSLTPGKLADVVIVDGDPLSDIFCLTHADHVKMVIKDGKIEKNTL